MYINMYIYFPVPYPLKMKTYSVVEARKNLPALMQAAETGQPVLITRRNNPAVVLVSEAAYRALADRRRGLVAFLSDWRDELTHHEVAGGEGIVVDQQR